MIFFSKKLGFDNIFLFELMVKIVVFNMFDLFFIFIRILRFLLGFSWSVGALYLVSCARNFVGRIMRFFVLNFGLRCWCS